MTVVTQLHLPALIALVIIVFRDDLTAFVDQPAPGRIASEARNALVVCGQIHLEECEIHPLLNIKTRNKKHRVRADTPDHRLVDDCVYRPDVRGGLRIGVQLFGADFKD